MQALRGRAARPRAVPRRLRAASPRGSRRRGERSALGQLLLKLTVAGRARHLPGRRARGAQPRRPRQPPAGRLGRAPRGARRAARRRARPTRETCKLFLIWRALDLRAPAAGGVRRRLRARSTPARACAPTCAAARCSRSCPCAPAGAAVARAAPRGAWRDVLTGEERDLGDEAAVADVVDATRPRAARARVGPGDAAVAPRRRAAGRSAPVDGLDRRRDRAAALRLRRRGPAAAGGGEPGQTSDVRVNRRATGRRRRRRRRGTSRPMSARGRPAAARSAARWPAAPQLASKSRCRAPARAGWGCRTGPKEPGSANGRLDASADAPRSAAGASRPPRRARRGTVISRLADARGAQRRPRRPVRDARSACAFATTAPPAAGEREVDRVLGGGLRRAQRGRDRRPGAGGDDARWPRGGRGDPRRSAVPGAFGPPGRRRRRRGRRTTLAPDRDRPA